MAIKAKVVTEDRRCLNHESDSLAQISVENHHLMQGGLDLVKINNSEIASVMVKHCSPIELILTGDKVIGFIKHTNSTKLQQLNPQFVA